VSATDDVIRGAHGWDNRAAGLLGGFPAEPSPCVPIGPCPKCGTVTAHLFGELLYHQDEPFIDRECRACGHTWQERLDG
jgi:hypothetical protein